MDRAVDDADLLRRYVRERSQAAFEELVRRYLDLVYAAGAFLDNPTDRDRLFEVWHRLDAQFKREIQPRLNRE